MWVDMVTEKGANRLKVGNRRLPAGEVIPEGTFNPRRLQTFKNRKWIETTQVEDPFEYNPSERTRNEILDDIEDMKLEYVAKVLEVERQGKNRKTVTEDLEQVLRRG